MTAPTTTAHRDAPAPPSQARRGVWIALVALGLALAVAPLVFGMFTRAPGGGRMLDDFRPFMTTERLDGFSTHLDTIDGAVDEATGPLAAAVAGTGGPELPATGTMAEQWPRIEEDMRGMLADIRANVDRYRAVDALPPFALFPWFFVVPGLAVAGLGVAGLRGSATTRRRVRGAVVATGVGIALAPLVFQMFTRAPAGAAMIDDLRPLMTRETVTTMQSSFLTIGSMEAELRTVALPAVAGDGGGGAYPAATALVEAWPRISGDMAPMIGAMADNLDEFAGIDALPPFWLFPWFFVLPGALTVGLAALARPAEATAPGDG